MKILAIDTSSLAASAALWEDGNLLGEEYIRVKLTHSQTSLPMVESLLAHTQVDLPSVDLLAVSVGPGSFTGLRIGIAAVKGMAYALGKPCAGISTLECLARNFLGIDGLVCSVMDARCKQVYTALFRIQGDCLQRLTPDKAISLADLQEQLTHLQEPVFLVGDGAQLCYNEMNQTLPHLRLAPEHLRHQHAGSLCTAGYEAFQRGETCLPQELAPVYLRLPQAERERMARMKKELEESKNENRIGK